MSETKKITSYFKSVSSRVHALNNELRFELLKEQEIMENERREAENEERKRRFESAREAAYDS